MATENRRKSLPEWIKRGGHERTGLKLTILVPEDYIAMLRMLTPEEQEKFEAIAEVLADATPDQQEAFKLTLVDILGYVTLIKYCGVEKVRKEVKEKITGNAKYDELMERMLNKRLN